MKTENLHVLTEAQWISGGAWEACPELYRTFVAHEVPVKAILTVTALGVYNATLNQSRVGDFYLAPGWTVYRERVQVQSYDVTAQINKGENTLSVILGGGWYSGTMARTRNPEDPRPALLATLTLIYADGKIETVVTDGSWSARESCTRYADIYHGETYDATFDSVTTETAASVRDLPKSMLIPQQGEEIVRMETLAPIRVFTTPKGEQVVDFGQEITGTLELTVKAPRGTAIRLNCAEMLDAEGNFYTENYRIAKSEMNYIAGGERETWMPDLTFYGFRYIRVEGVDVAACDLRAVVLCSDIKRTGTLTSGVQKLNRLFENIIWGQKGNFLDVPTDCPQRNERLGWTGDAQVFANTACWQFDVKRFFEKWLADVMIEQRENGAIPSVVPEMFFPIGHPGVKASTAWGDAATVCPWQVYRHYGDRELLATHFKMMKGWIAYMSSVTDDPYLWTGYENRQKHYGDWLGLDAPEGSYVGSSDKDLIASAFYYYSTGLVVLAGRELGEDVTEYETLQANILRTFRERFGTYKTQTECALALHFGLAEDPAAVAETLARLIHENGDCLTTGFVGTPYLLFALSENGRTDLAYTLLLQDKFPSWLFSVDQGATTIWEHWDGKKADGSFWSADMNSFNHYAYGSVASWVFEVAAGITPAEPGFGRIRIQPRPDSRLGWLRAEHDIPAGKIVSAWYCEGDHVRYEIITPVETVAVIDGREYTLTPGSYLF